MSTSGRFAVDTDRLNEAVHDLERDEADLEVIAADLELAMRRLHSVWEGRAALAQRVAHREWEQGFATMHAALADLRRAARTAHDNYDADVRTNLTMWERLR